ncbi:hypothetical protein [Paenibacillus caui]|uniref:hypothetical protein n=1 Tax=Paenibacillus caui TaxID=2873927 RepID=UPI001CA880EB|nr:hypothetical protein [Paenibacillus caui]
MSKHLPLKWLTATVLMLTAAGCGYADSSSATTLEGAEAKLNEGIFTASEFYGGTSSAEMLKELRMDCAEQDIRLTHEINTEDLDGNLSTSYYINGDSHHYVIVYRYNRESTRIAKIRGLYGTDKDSRSPLIRTAGRTALVYVSSGSEKGKYSDKLENIFDQVLK